MEAAAFCGRTRAKSASCGRVHECVRAEARMPQEEISSAHSVVSGGVQ